jgi:hypothetical protein
MKIIYMKLMRYTVKMFYIKYIIIVKVNKSILIIKNKI